MNKCAKKHQRSRMSVVGIIGRDTLLFKYDLQFLIKSLAR